MAVEAAGEGGAAGRARQEAEALAQRGVPEWHRLGRGIRAGVVERTDGLARRTASALIPIFLDGARAIRDAPRAKVSVAAGSGMPVVHIADVAAARGGRAGRGRHEWDIAVYGVRVLDTLPRARARLGSVHSQGLVFAGIDLRQHVRYHFPPQIK